MLHVFVILSWRRTAARPAQAPPHASPLPAASLPFIRRCGGCRARSGLRPTSSCARCGEAWLLPVHAPSKHLAAGCACGLRTVERPGRPPLHGPHKRAAASCLARSGAAASCLARSAPRKPTAPSSLLRPLGLAWLTHCFCLPPPERTPPLSQAKDHFILAAWPVEPCLTDRQTVCLDPSLPPRVQAKDHFIFTIESTGAWRPHELFKYAVDVRPPARSLLCSCLHSCAGSSADAAAASALPTRRPPSAPTLLLPNHRRS